TPSTHPDSAAADTYTPSLHDALPICITWAGKREVDSLCNREELASLRYPEGGPTAPEKAAEKIVLPPEFDIRLVASEPLINKARSEEHTSELQSLRHLVCRLLLEKKK